MAGKNCNIMEHNNCTRPCSEYLALIRYANTTIVSTKSTLESPLLKLQEVARLRGEIYLRHFLDHFEVVLGVLRPGEFDFHTYKAARARKKGENKDFVATGDLPIIGMIEEIFARELFSE